MSKYQLQIYLPNNVYDVGCVIDSNQPFLPIQRGDIINPRGFTSHYYGTFQEAEPRQYGIVLRVTGIEHVIAMEPNSEIGFTRHVLNIFTEAIDDVETSRP